MYKFFGFFITHRKNEDQSCDIVGCEEQWKFYVYDELARQTAFICKTHYAVIKIIEPNILRFGNR